MERKWKSKYCTYQCTYVKNCNKVCQSQLLFYCSPFLVLFSSSHQISFFTSSLCLISLGWQIRNVKKWWIFCEGVCVCHCCWWYTLYLLIYFKMNMFCHWGISIVKNACFINMFSICILNFLFLLILTFGPIQKILLSRLCRDDSKGKIDVKLQL